MLRVGLIGLGRYSSSYHVSHLRRRTDCVISAVCDPGISESALQAAGTKELFRDHKELLRSGLVDAVIVSTPHALHFEQAAAALSAGIPVMVDKPLTLHSKDAFSLVELSRRSNLLLMTALNRHFDPGTRYVRQAVDSRSGGEIQFVSSLQRGFAFGRDEHHWLDDPAVGGGMLYGRTSHMADAIPWVLSSDVTEVNAEVDYGGNATDRRSVVWLRMANGLLAEMVSLARSDESQDAIDVYGSRRSFHLERPRGAGYWVATVKERDGSSHALESDQLPAGSTSTDNFIDAILGKDKPRATGLDGARAVRVIEAAIESGRLRKPVSV